MDKGWPILCGYCLGTGYEDYTTCKKPCRIKGHRELADRHHKALMTGIVVEIGIARN